MNTLKFSATGQLKGGAVTNGQKSSHDVIRNLKLDLESLRDENEELQSEMSIITQKYLNEKSRAEELVHELGVMHRNESGQKRTIEKIVQKKLKETQAKNLKLIEHQKQSIEKQHLYKQCLSKNVQDLQERLRATRQDLLHSQKQVFAFQKQYPVEPLVIQKQVSSSQGSEKLSYSSRKSNKIMHLNFEGINEEEETTQKHQKPDDVKIQGRQLNYLSRNDEVGAQKSGKNQRSKLLVAKSLAIGRGGQKYDWLFNEDETPRNPADRDENVQTDQTSARYNNQTGQKLMKNNREQLPQTDRSDKITVASSNIKSTNIKKMKHNQFAENHQFSDEFGNTIESSRANGDDSLLNLNKQKNLGSYHDYGNMNRPSIVKQSLNGVKNIFKKAADGLRVSGQAETIGEFQSNGHNLAKIAQNALEVNHDQVEIELESSRPGETQETPNGQSNGQNSLYVPQNHNKSLINDFADQNPLDDDSN